MYVLTKILDINQITIKEIKKKRSDINYNMCKQNMYF